MIGLHSGNIFWNRNTGSNSNEPLFKAFPLLNLHKVQSNGKNFPPRDIAIHSTTQYQPEELIY